MSGQFFEYRSACVIDPLIESLNLVCSTTAMYMDFTTSASAAFIP